MNEEGTYWLRVESKASCANADTTKLQSLKEPERLQKDSVITCQSEAELDAGNPDADHQWNSGKNTQTIKATTSGTYTVAIANAFCSIRDTVEVQLNQDAECPYLRIPNAFSPNDDGINDVFKPGYQNIRSFRMTIHNRWGERVFQTNDINKGWDGTMNGEPAPVSNYMYRIVYKAEEKGVLRIQTKDGTFRLLR